MCSLWEEEVFYFYFKIFNNIKSEHEVTDFAKLELESLFGEVEPIDNFIDKLREEPLNKFTHSSIRIQDFITHELPYGKIQGYWGTSETIRDITSLVKRLSYIREIYLIMNENKSPSELLRNIFPDGVEEKNVHYFRKDGHLLFRFITNQYFIEKSQYISKLSRDEKEVERNVEILSSHLIKDIYRIPASSTLSIGKRLQDYFAIREEPSLYLTHYFHPYKGKFHPKMIRALLNYIYPKSQGRIFDNFAGSGTLLVEASLLGLDSMGVEINPLSCLMSNVKCYSLNFDTYKLKDNITEYLEILTEDIYNWRRRASGNLLLFKGLVNYHWVSEQSKQLCIELKNALRDKEKTVPQVLIARELLKNINDEEIKNFLLLSLSGTISDVARRTSDQFLDVLRGRLNDLYLRIFLFQELNKTLKIRLGKSKTYIADTRNMGKEIPSDSIDGIVNSPPYAVALDYIKNDYPQLVLLELTESISQLERDMMGNPRVNYDRKELREKLTKKDENLTDFSETGNKIVNYLISNGRQQAGLRSFKFFTDMIKTLREMKRVLRKGSKAAIVIGNNHFMVGDNTIEVPNSQVLLEIAENLGFKVNRLIGRKLQKSSEGIIREETVLILKKE